MTKSYLTDGNDEILTDGDGDALYIVTESPIPAPPTPPLPPRYRIDLCAGFVRIGEAESATFHGIIRHARVGEWVLSAPLSGLSVETGRLSDVDSVIVWDDGNAPSILFAGLIRDVGGVSGSTTRQVTTDGTTIELRGVDLFGLLAQRVSWPTPSMEPPWVDSHDVRTGVGSTVAAGYITDNIGSGALASRQVAGLMVVDPEVGSSSTWSARLERLDLLVGRVCRDSGVVARLSMPTPGEVRFELTSGSDVSNKVILTDQGDLEVLTRLVTPPAASCVIAAGQGELTARAFAVADTGATGIDRVELLYDNTNITTTPGLVTAAASQLAQSGGGTSVDGTVAAGAAQRVRYRDDYDLGDVLGVEIDSVRLSAKVEGVSFELTSEVQRVLPVLGRASTDAAVEVIRSVDDLSSRFDRQVA